MRVVEFPDRDGKTFRFTNTKNIIVTLCLLCFPPLHTFFISAIPLSGSALQKQPVSSMFQISCGNLSSTLSLLTLPDSPQIFLFDVVSHFPVIMPALRHLKFSVTKTCDHHCLFGEQTSIEIHVFLDTECIPLHHLSHRTQKIDFIRVFTQTAAGAEAVWLVF